MTEYRGKGNYPSYYISDYLFYRDLDPLFYEGDGPMDMTNILKKSDVPGGT